MEHVPPLLRIGSQIPRLCRTFGSFEPNIGTDQYAIIPNSIRPISELTAGPCADRLEDQAPLNSGTRELLRMNQEPVYPSLRRRDFLSAIGGGLLAVSAFSSITGCGG